MMTTENFVLLTIVVGDALLIGAALWFRQTAINNPAKRRVAIARLDWRSWFFCAALLAFTATQLYDGYSLHQFGFPQSNNVSIQYHPWIFVCIGCVYSYSLFLLGIWTVLGAANFFKIVREFFDSSSKKK